MNNIKNKIQYYFNKKDSFSLNLAITFFGSLFFVFFSVFSAIFYQGVGQAKSSVLTVLSISVPEVQAAESKDSDPKVGQQEQKEVEKKEEKLPELQKEVELKQDFEAESIIVKDHETGKVLLKKNPYQEHSMASITKLMSALVFLETDPDWDRRVNVVSDDIIGSHVSAGEEYRVKDLWSAALIGSSNKSMLTLADIVDWPREAFVQRMNQKALELGMSDTYFVEPTGLEKENVSTASDMAILLAESLKHRKIQQTLTTNEYNLEPLNTPGRHHVWNTNWILLDWISNDFQAMYGGKTGYIEASGYNFSMQVSDKQGNLLDVVVLGTNSHEARFEVARDAAEWVFENYNWPK